MDWDKTKLNRSSDSSDGYVVEPGYLATTKCAEEDTFDVADSVKSSGSKSTTNEKIDIFGVPRSWSQSAHLVPNSKPCSTWRSQRLVGNFMPVLAWLITTTTCGDAI